MTFIIIIILFYHNNNHIHWNCVVVFLLEMAKRNLKLSQSLWDDDDEDEDHDSTAQKAANSITPDDYKLMYDGEVERRKAAEDLVTELELRIISLTKELSMYKGIVADEIDENGSADDGLQPVVSLSNPNTLSDKPNSASAEWQLLADQERERRQKARTRNARGSAKRASSHAANKIRSAEEVRNVTTDPVTSSSALSSSTMKHENIGLEKNETEPMLSKKPAISNVLDWSSSSEDEKAKVETLILSNDQQDRDAEADTLASSTGQPSATLHHSASSEWERLAAEERERKQRARQRQLQQSSTRGRGRGATSSAARRSTAAKQMQGATATAPRPTEVSSSGIGASGFAVETGMVSDKPETVHRRRSRGMSMGSGSGWSDSEEDQQKHVSSTTNRARDDSFFDSDHESEDEDTSKPLESQPNASGLQKAPFATIPNTHSIQGASTDDTKSTLETAIDGEVLAWAAGKSISHLIQSCGFIFPMNVPNLGPQWQSHLVPPQDPASVRKAFL